MSNANIPGGPWNRPGPSVPDTRPLRKRAGVWAGGAALFVMGALAGSAGDGTQPTAQEARPKVAVTATATVTVTTTPEPGPTVTATETVKVKVKPKPAPTVTKTVTMRAAAGSGGSGGSGGGGGGGTTTCSIRSNSGNCYQAGQFCRNSDHGATTTTASGARITCRYSANAWRWTYS